MISIVTLIMRQSRRSPLPQGRESLSHKTGRKRTMIFFLLLDQQALEVAAMLRVMLYLRLMASLAVCNMKHLIKHLADHIQATFSMKPISW
jgi:hypothetical protein